MGCRFEGYHPLGEFQKQSNHLFFLSVLCVSVVKPGFLG